MRERVRKREEMGEGFEVGKGEVHKEGWGYGVMVCGKGWKKRIGKVGTGEWGGGGMRRERGGL